MRKFFEIMIKSIGVENFFVLFGIIFGGVENGFFNGVIYVLRVLRVVGNIG